MRTEISAASTEAIAVPVSHLVVGSPLDITTLPVSISMTLPDTNPTTWESATWQTINNQTCAVANIGPGTTVGALAPGVYDCWVKVVNTPEIPVMKCDGKVNIYG